MKKTTLTPADEGIQSARKDAKTKWAKKSILTPADEGIRAVRKDQRQTDGAK